MSFLFTNNANTILASGISSTTTTLTVASGKGALFPNPSGGSMFAITLTDAATQTIREIVYCTGRSGDVMTVVRGQEGTTAESWLAGDLVSHQVTAGVLDDFDQIGGVLSGSIFLWFGNAGSVPSGYAICDGSNGTPDLRGRFVVGATGDSTGTYPQGATGGAASNTPTITVTGHILLQAEIPSFAASVSDPTHVHANTLGDPTHVHANTLSDPTHSHADTLNDPGHLHSFGAVVQTGIGNQLGGGGGQFQQTVANTGGSGTGITINNVAAATGLTINNTGAATGLTISNVAAGTGITVNIPGGNGAHAHGGSSTVVPTVPPYKALYYVMKL